MESAMLMMMAQIKDFGLLLFRNADGNLKTLILNYLCMISNEGSRMESTKTSWPELEVDEVLYGFESTWSRLPHTKIRVDFELCSWHFSIVLRL